MSHFTGQSGATVTGASVSEEPGMKMLTHSLRRSPFARGIAQQLSSTTWLPKLLACLIIRSLRCFATHIDNITLTTH